MDKSKVVTAAAHKLARLIYTLLKGQAYTDQRQDYYEERYRERVLRHLSQRAKQMGLKLVPDQQSPKSITWEVFLERLRVRTMEASEIRWFSAAVSMAQ